MAVSATALTSLARAQSYLNDTDNPTLMEFAIDAVSARIENWLDRKIREQDFSEIYDVPHNGTLILNQPDIVDIDFVAMDTFNGLRVQYTGSDTNARVEVTDAAVKTTSRVGGTSSATSSTFAANVTTAALATAIGAVSGWSASLINSAPSAYLMRTGSRNAKDSWVDLEVWEEFDGEYETDYPAGVVTFELVNFASFGQRGRMRVDYTAGLTLPADVEQTALEMLRQVWDLRNVNTGLQSESDGDYAYTLADQVNVSDSEVWMGRLGRYRRARP